MYNKIFTKILDSSIWLEPSSTRIIWLTCLAAMDEDGYAHFASLANLAHRAIVPLDEAQAAVETLESPDPNSSDPEHEGRRLERVPGGWIVLNAVKYRDIVTRIAGKERNRIRVAAHRQRKREGITCNDSVMAGNGMSEKRNDEVMESDTDTEADTDTKTLVRNVAPKRARRANVPESVDEMIARLSKNPAYEGIDLQRAWGRMVAWCEVNSKLPSARRFVNWLNREDRPVVKSGNGKSPPAEPYVSEREKYDRSLLADGLIDQDEYDRRQQAAKPRFRDSVQL